MTIIQHLASGRPELIATPEALPNQGSLAIRTRTSLISAGTERMLVEFGRANLLQKAMQQPDRVRDVLAKARTDGIASTVSAVRSKLDQPITLGYCNAGIVTAVGSDTKGFVPGDRVASNGNHAVSVVVPANLCAHIPNAVSDDAAAFTVIGAVALQGIRLAQPTLGEAIVVTGLGLVGLLTVQLLMANGCRVLGIDPDPMKISAARAFGAETVDLAANEDPIEGAREFSRGRGVDAVLLTLSSDSSEPVRQAARMCRQRGRIVLVGVTGLQFDRQPLYEKEITFQVSSSYGPGRYDPEYEVRGNDYPFGLVRWTAQRNFEAFLDLLASGAVDVKPLITHRFVFSDAPSAYDLLASGREPSLGILLQYPATGTESPSRTVLVTPPPQERTSAPRVSVIGAGNYASRVLIPALVATEAQLVSLASEAGVTATTVAGKHGFLHATTDVTSLIEDLETAAIIIATRHDSHASLAGEALRAGKHVFVEKPLALTRTELDELMSLYRASEENGLQAPSGAVAGILTVGFNRRFAPHAKKAKALLDTLRGPKALVFTINAGPIPRNHWTQDPKTGGGRIVGEACHFIDLARFLIGAPIASSDVRTVAHGSRTSDGDDIATLSLGFADGSITSINYLANGHPHVPKERVEAFAGGKVLRLDNFTRLTGFGWKGFKSVRSFRQDKGQRACIQAFIDSIRTGGPPPIPLDELFEVSRVAIELGEASR